MSAQNNSDYQEKKDNRILDGLHYYLCSRDYNANFDEELDNINLNVEGDDENKNSDVNNLVVEESTKLVEQEIEIQKQQPVQTFTNLAMIPTSFNDAEDYIKTFEQHLFSEAKAQIQKAQVVEVKHIQIFILTNILVEYLNAIIQQSRQPEQMRLKNSVVMSLKNNSELFFRKLTMEKLKDSETKYGTHDFIVISLQDVK